MKKILLPKWFRDTSISRKLYFTVIIMAVLISIELFALSFSLNALSAVRAYVGGEGLWSKAQKDAMSELLKYGNNHNEQHYRRFNEYMKVILGDGKARAEMAKPHPDWEAAKQGFIVGRNHREDVPGMVDLFRRFNKISYIERAIIAWSNAEPRAMQLFPIAEKLHAEINSPAPRQQNINAIMSEIEPLNVEITKYEDEFSFALGEGSRWLEGVVLKLLFAIALTVELTGLLIAVSVSRTIQKGLSEIIDAAKDFAAGKLNARARVFSMDEIGVVATSFNHMSDQLQQNMQQQEEARLQSEELLASLQKSESEVRALNESLERKVAKRTEELELANKELEAFSYSVSHDLRTPLRSINGFSKILNRNYADKLDDEGREYLALISDNATRMGHLIDGLLKLARVDRGTLVKKTVDLNELVDEVLADLKNSDSSFKTEINIQPLKPAMGDRVLIKQVWANLIGNAIKYSRNNKAPVVEVGNITEHGTVVYYVKDNGAGFDMKYSDQLFGAFKRLHKEQEFEGTGVGLALVHRVITRHGGRIWASSSPNRGATFFFTLSA